MSILAWIVLGLIAGFIASKIVSHRGQGLVVNIILGIAGAVLGGWVVVRFGGSGISGFNLYSMLVAICGAIVLLGGYHLIRRLSGGT